MSHTDPAFVIHHVGDEAAYAIMRSWCDFDGVGFDFRDASDLGLDAKNAADAATALDAALAQTRAVIILIGDETRDASGPLLWQIEAAARSALPIVCVNLNLVRKHQSRKLPKALKGRTALHVSFDMKIVRHALDQWPKEFKGSDGTQRLYDVPVYRKLYL